MEKISLLGLVPGLAKLGLGGPREGGSRQVGKNNDFFPDIIPYPGFPGCRDQQKNGTSEGS